MKEYGKFYINGAWVAPQGQGHFDVINSSTEEIMGRIPSGNEADADAAVAAAKAAFPGWAATSVEDRAGYLLKIQAGLQAKMQDLADTISGEVGMPIKMSNIAQAGLPTMQVGNYAQFIKDTPLEEKIGNSIVVKEPVGVVAAITPWNYPLNQVIEKVAPALAAGCTVVLKPSEVAPLSAFMLAEVIHEAGLPAGVFNLVSGLGTTVGEALVKSKDVDMVSFTGSTGAGKRISEIASATVKRVALELGGKSANIILDDADFEKAVKGGVNHAYQNSGQTCNAQTRMLVPESRYEEAVGLAKKAAEKLTLGNAQKGEGRLGPLASDIQRKRVRAYIEKGVAEGARLVTGGAEAPEGLDKGYYVKPTIFADVKNSMAIAQEEIFGPVLCIIPYKDEDDAVAIANDSLYGLGGGVWSADTERAKKVARRIRTGQVDINGGQFNPTAPFGGFKQSGRGRERGAHGLDEFFEVKSMQF
jgi:acyl-CoA reductase-like NAD-dependent aldehyde dehydrogenase